MSEQPILFLYKCECKKLNVDPNIETEELLELAKIHFGLDPRHITITVEGFVLSEDEKLRRVMGKAEFKIGEEVEVYVKVQDRGGGPISGFDGPTLENLVESAFSSSAAVYRQLQRGAALEFSCKTCNKSVLVNIGFSEDQSNDHADGGWFRMSELLTTLSCSNPDCEKDLIDEWFKNYYFWMCKVEFKGYSKTEKRKITGYNVYDKEDKFYKASDVEVENPQKWSYMNLKVNRIEKKRMTKSYNKGSGEQPIVFSYKDDYRRLNVDPDIDHEEFLELAKEHFGVDPRHITISAEGLVLSDEMKLKRAMGMAEFKIGEEVEVRVKDN